MAMQRGGEIRDKKTLKVSGNGDPVNTDEEVEEPDNGRSKFDSTTAVVPKLAVRKQSLKAYRLAFLSLLLLLSIAPSKVTSDHRCDDGWKGIGFKYNWEKDTNMVEEDLLLLNSDDHDFGRDTNRLDYFRVIAFDVFGDNQPTGNTSYDDGGRRSDGGVVVGPRLEQGGTMPGDVIQPVPAGIVTNDGSDGGEPLVQILEPEDDDGVGGGGGDVGYLVMVGWWEKWWVWLGLWKIL
ncbi:hypothetical protein L2E82_18325 [Cichorium intybus]|uniref:Uncharacterized protein n=1 Tax=Cichorium intybus TaxID=13427 RepID=A0ACB9FAN3_CICIN|nr:hypothetical protein L2E82_18325 [Cichorium intybus]